MIVFVNYNKYYKFLFTIDLLDFYCIIDPEIEASMQWLKENANAPLKEVTLSHWERTAPLRTRDFINCDDKNIVKIYQKWPILHQTNGFQLIISDFNYLQYTKIEINNENWNTFFQSIKDLCDERKKDERTKFFENLLNEENLSNGKLKLL